MGPAPPIGADSRAETFATRRAVAGETETEGRPEMIAFWSATIVGILLAANWGGRNDW